MTTNNSMPLVTQRLRERSHQAQLQQRGLPALKHLADVAQGDSHQPQHCRRVLLAVYNSVAWPLNLTSLRALDDDLRRAALAVIEWSAVSDHELHEYLPHGHKLMQRFAAIEKQEEQ